MKPNRDRDHWIWHAKSSFTKINGETTVGIFQCRHCREYDWYDTCTDHRPECPLVTGNENMLRPVRR